jgi:peptide/nickel transport system substrate-binding protein
VTSLATVTAVVLVGCGSSGSSPEGSTKASAPATTTATEGGDGSGGRLIVGMTAANIPSMDTMLSGAQGYEGFRFVGDPLYDGLTRLDLSDPDEAPTVEPALAVSWEPNDDATRWRFKLREGVTFTDGTPWNADAAVFNFGRYLDPDDEHTTPQLAAIGRAYMPAVAGARKIDDMTIEVSSKISNSHLPEDIVHVYMGSPTAIRKEGGKGFGGRPVGTGPFKLDSTVRQEQATFVPNPSYWRGPPKLDELVIKPIPDPTARTAALRSGAVNWIEYPMPDDVRALASADFQVLTNSYSHIWPWMLNLAKKPWSDPRVRQAMNYALDRDAMVESLLHGTADAAKQVIPRAHPSFTEDDDVYSLDREKAKQLLSDAGYPDGFEMTVKTPISGSGNMIPGPMNEALQQDLAAVGIRVKLRPAEWSTVITEYYSGKFPSDADALNISLPMEEEAGWPAYFDSKSYTNSGRYKNPEVDRLIAEAQTVVETDDRLQLYQEAGRLITEDAPWLFVVNDRSPRAMAPGVRGFVQPRSWFIDLTTTWVR